MYAKIERQLIKNSNVQWIQQSRNRSIWSNDWEKLQISISIAYTNKFIYVGKEGVLKNGWSQFNQRPIES
jgi:hypothetical protein